MSRRDRAELDRAFSAVRQVLQDVWNPVGAGGLPADEYDSYVWPIVGLLRGGAAAGELTEHLRNAERDFFSRESDSANLAHVVRALLALQVDANKES